MSTLIQCEVVTPERQLYSADATFVVLPAANGEMGIYYKHAPVVTYLNDGCMRVTGENAEEVTRIAVAGGYAQVDGQKVIVLANRAALLSDVDAAEVDAKLEQLSAELKELGDDDVTASFKKNELAWYELLKHQLQVAEA